MAANRLDDEGDNIENTLSMALLDTYNTTSKRSIAVADPLASSTWEKVVFFYQILSFG